MNKIIVIAIVLVVLIGGFVVFKGVFKSNETTKTTPQTQTTTTNPETNEKSTTVKLSSSGFSPATIEVAPGTRVVFINESGESATVNSDDHPNHTKYPFLNLGEFGDNSSVQAVFEKAGTYSYHNHLNPSQKGTVVVK